MKYRENMFPKNNVKMEILGLRIPLVKPGEDLIEPLLKSASKIGGFKNGDVLVISSKLLATSKGELKKLSEINPSARAKRLATKADLEPELAELVLHEADQVLETAEGAILTLKDGLACANAGIDRSNVPKGYVALMPVNPDLAAEEIRKVLVKRTGAEIAVVMADSNVKPLRLGTVGQAIGVAGLEPVIDCRGELDLYGKPLKVTFRAIADQLATAAQLVMGEAAEKIPAAIIRGLNSEMVERPKLSPKVPPNKCIFFKSFLRNR